MIFWPLHITTICNTEFIPSLFGIARFVYYDRRTTDWSKMRAVLPLCFLVAVRAAPVEDEVTLPLPGLSIQLPWKHYSGYLNGTGERKLHYWFIQSSNPEPEYDPLVLWLNGGPGCSSIVGLLLEHGPFKLQDDGERLEMNPFSWNRVANMLYMEAPVGVGYSYTDSPLNVYTDSIVAMDNYKALTHFYIKFPELKGNEFFIAGESYGGFYVPTLSELVLNDLDINFKGFALGNGLLDFDWLNTAMIYFFYNHGVMGEKEWTELHKRCCKKGNFQRCNLESSVACGRELIEFITTTRKAGINMYDLYAKCYGERFSFIPRYRLESFKKQDELKDILYWRELSTGYPCFDSTFLDRYMNKERVREALHIPDNLGAWTTCSDDVGRKYRFLQKNVSEAFQIAFNNQRRILVYNGDVDPIVSYQSNQWFLDDLSLKETQSYTPWGLKDEMGNIQNAGFLRSYKNLDFVTIKGAGHKVPRDKPREAFHVFTNFIKGTPLK